ncbi:MAG: Hsp33 family molecular chaperone HslO [Thermoanaerobaculia bacterium]|nr:Hsp33 family molecular chaperone HslO [Thermoanaerobaculia bacterium]
MDQIPNRILPPLYDLGVDVATGSLRLGIAGDLRWAVVDLSEPAEYLRARLDLAPIPAVALGRAMSAAALLLRFSSKNPGTLRFEILGEGPLGRLMVEVDDEGLLRATVAEQRFGFEDGSLDVGRAVGDGTLRVTQTFPGSEPWVSQVKLVSGEIGQDLVHFLHQSQQVRSAALLGVLPTPDGIAAAGGLLVEALPGADDQQVRQLEQRIDALDGIGTLLEQGGADRLAEELLASFEPEELERHTLRYGCRCSRESLRQRLLSLPAEDLTEAVDEKGTCVVVCAYCDGSIAFGPDDLGLGTAAGER